MNKKNNNDNYKKKIIYFSCNPIQSLLRVIFLNDGGVLTSIHMKSASA